MEPVCCSVSSSNLLPDLHIGFSRHRSGGLVFPSLEEFSTVCCDPHKGFGVVNKAEIDVFLELSCLFYDPANVGNLISGSSAFSKTSLNIWKFTVHLLLKPGLENFEHYFEHYKIDGETMEKENNVSKTTADGDCIHEIRRHLLLGRKVMTNLDSMLKSRDITLSTKLHLVKVMVYPVAMYRCESWTTA